MASRTSAARRSNSALYELSTTIAMTLFFMLIAALGYALFTYELATIHNPGFAALAASKDIPTENFYFGVIAGFLLLAIAGLGIGRNLTFTLRAFRTHRSAKTALAEHSRTNHNRDAQP